VVTTNRAAQVEDGTRSSEFEFGRASGGHETLESRSPRSAAGYPQLRSRRIIASRATRSQDPDESSPAVLPAARMVTGVATDAARSPRARRSSLFELAAAHDRDKGRHLGLRAALFATAVTDCRQAQPFFVTAVADYRYWQHQSASRCAISRCG